MGRTRRDGVHGAVKAFRPQWWRQGPSAAVMQESPKVRHATYECFLRFDVCVVSGGSFAGDDAPPPPRGGATSGDEKFGPAG